MNGFKEYHPAVSFIYFAAMILFSMFFMNPVCLAASFFGAFLYAVMLRRAKFLRYIIPAAVFAAALNPLFNHGGATILFYLKNGNSFTAESICYGLAAAAMICTVSCWFACFNAVVTQDKIIYLFGRLIPSMSLILSMVLRFVPEFGRKIKEISNAQKGLNVKKPRMKNAAAVFGAFVNASLEDAVETADSMTCRGYGLKGRTSYSNYIFTKRDGALLAVSSAAAVYIIIGAVFGAMKFRYFPTLSGSALTPYTISVFGVYFAMCVLPSIIEITEVCRWKAIKSKI